MDYLFSWDPVLDSTLFIMLESEIGFPHGLYTSFSVKFRR